MKKDTYNIKRDHNVRSKTRLSSRELVVQSLVSQEQELDTTQDTSKLVETFKRWLPRNFNELMYGLLTLVCAGYALHTNNAPLLTALWTAAAAQIGVPTASNAFTSIVERIAAPKDNTKPKRKTATKD